MKKVFLLFSMFLLAKAGSAQFSLTFCEDVTSEGRPTMVSNSFMVDNTGGLVRFYLKADDKLSTSQVDFKVYYVSSSGKEEQLTTFSQATGNDWDYVWKEAAFYDAGTYRIKAYNQNGTYLTSANLIVKQK